MSEGDAFKFLDKTSTTFQRDLIKALLKSKFSNPKTKISEDVIDIITELAKVMALEAAGRSAHIALMEKKKIVALEHVELILPQLMLDFS
ncbi:centromere protein X-like [Sitophilus oryzae]|uniref:Centromere protein X n=1 Tax=Sitophilus oryzae TaxID=7048 RepID=A0A6J2YDV7_SITOR|nr:centromere protein X-like [Sitophilus oryzae]XP_030761070.1 centromere protein X-like [Sitophilus oryzae]XP_030761071.1 centromere protein X-like [Sitophilus oryzae]